MPVVCTNGSCYVAYVFYIMSSSSVILKTYFLPRQARVGRFHRVDNQTSGDTLQDLTRPLVETSPSVSYPPMGIGSRFWWRDALPHQPVGIREETLESGNLFSGRLVEFPPPYHVNSKMVVTVACLQMGVPTCPIPPYLVQERKKEGGEERKMDELGAKRKGEGELREDLN